MWEAAEACGTQRGYVRPARPPHPKGPGNAWTWSSYVDVWSDGRVRAHRRPRNRQRLRLPAGHRLRVDDGGDDADDARNGRPRRRPRRPQVAMTAAALPLPEGAASRSGLERVRTAFAAAGAA